MASSKGATKKLVAKVVAAANFHVDFLNLCKSEEVIEEEIKAKLKEIGAFVKESSMDKVAFRILNVDDKTASSWLGDTPETKREMEIFLARNKRPLYNVKYVAGMHGMIAHVLAGHLGKDEAAGPKPNVPEPTIVDFGGGDGSLAIALAEAGCTDVNYVDYNPNALKFAQWRLEKKGLMKNVGFYRTLDKLHGMLGDNSVQFFCAIDTLGHMPAAVAVATMKRIRDMLTDDGEFICYFRPHPYNADNAPWRQMEYSWFDKEDELIASAGFKVKWDVHWVCKSWMKA